MIFELFRISHIIAGFLALFIFWIPIVVRKGGKIHRKIGWVYTYSMAVVAITAFYMGFYRIFYDPAGDQTFSWFLVYIAILSAATAWYGIRVLQFKKRKTPHRHVADLAFSFTLLTSSALISVYGFYIDMPLLSYFPAVGLFVGGSQLSYWLRKPSIKGHWYIEHLIGMLACSISTITAFIVFGAPRLLNIESVSIFLWFAPTIVITPVIIGFSVHYGRKFNQKVI
ncbi:DUF2306 domain-containing protein [Gracilibacillus saliphilus]|uniref:DUF2306 domain-containing protein n=1 Tax=Gracilibacillus saliphilus TaxID=543890 RepID=UPI0018780F59|nr:DUF2306 domain-containing protein [Gracilibacillus saliphilus]